MASRTTDQALIRPKKILMFPETRCRLVFWPAPKVFMTHLVGTIQQQRPGILLSFAQSPFSLPRSLLAVYGWSLIMCRQHGAANIPLQQVFLNQYALSHAHQ